MSQSKVEKYFTEIMQIHQGRSDENLTISQYFKTGINEYTVIKVKILQVFSMKLPPLNLLVYYEINESVTMLGLKQKICNAYISHQEAIISVVDTTTLVLGAQAEKMDHGLKLAVKVWMTILSLKRLLSLTFQNFSY